MLCDSDASCLRCFQGVRWGDRHVAGFLWSQIRNAHCNTALGESFDVVGTMVFSNCGQASLQLASALVRWHQVTCSYIFNTSSTFATGSG